MKRIVLVLATLLPVLAWAQSYPLFKPANGILKGQTSTYVTTSATALDVSGLFSGVCDNTTYLRGDGVCDTPSGTGIGTVTSVAMTWASSGISISGSPITSSGTLALSGTLNVASGGTGATTLTGLLEGSGTGAINPAEVADVITLWTGTCDTTTFLRGDGSCQTIPGNTDASTLTTGTLADARLSSNVPLKNAANSMSGVNTFTSSSDNTGAVIVSNNSPVYGWIEGDAATDEKRYRAFVSSGDFNLALLNDANTTSTTFMAVARTGMTADSIGFTSTALNHNGNAVLNSTSSLNGSNIGSGTVADARLSSNVALKNVGDPTFSIAGNNRLVIANSSTGFATVRLDTNGLTRGDLCTSTSANVCVVGDAANDLALRSNAKLNITTNGSTKVAVLDSAQIDLNATTVNANSSRINTVANSGKIAYANVDGPSGNIINSLNVTSVTRNSTGSYSINLTAAGFTVKPVCVVNSAASSAPAGIASSATGPSYSTNVLVNTLSVSGSAVIYTPSDPSQFNFVCHGL